MFRTTTPRLPVLLGTVLLGAAAWAAPPPAALKPLEVHLLEAGKLSPVDYDLTLQKVKLPAIDKDALRNLLKTQKIQPDANLLELLVDANPAPSADGKTLLMPAFKRPDGSPLVLAPGQRIQLTYNKPQHDVLLGQVGAAYDKAGALNDWTRTRLPDAGPLRRELAAYRRKTDALRAVVSERQRPIPKDLPGSLAKELAAVEQFLARLEAHPEDWPAATEQLKRANAAMDWHLTGFQEDWGRIGILGWSVATPGCKVRVRVRGAPAPVFVFYRQSLVPEARFSFPKEATQSDDGLISEHVVPCHYHEFWATADQGGLRKLTDYKEARVTKGLELDLRPAATAPASEGQ
ncbi:MAG: hypothetical protein KC613_17520 [Myxococcales bacterium]|nr:hypothetical protein [Myxococcales bacterium]MCB9525102.1 hypothetical protein [Myxococcales bacterium]